MQGRDIVITSFDRDRLRSLVLDIQQDGAKLDERPDLRDLIKELDRAQVVEPSAIPAQKVTMNSQVTLKDRKTDELITLTLVFPQDADFLENKVSVFAPIGVSILGYGEGDDVDWPVPGGVRELTIISVDYQPEAQGDFTR